MALYAIVKRGQNKGIVVKPHKYEDGRYHVAKKKEDIPIPVNLDELDSATFGFAESRVRRQDRNGVSLRLH